MPRVPHSLYTDVYISWTHRPGLSTEIWED